MKYKILVGKHYVGKDPETGKNKYAHAGDVIELDEAQAKRFKNKFELVKQAKEEEEVSTGEEKTETSTTSETQTETVLTE